MNMMGDPNEPGHDEELFKGLVVTNPGTKPRGPLGWSASVLAHAALIAGLVLVPLFWSGPLPPQPNYIRALIYNPPPPPPPPPARGSTMLEDPKPPEPQGAEPEPTPEPQLTAQLDFPDDEELLPDPGDMEDQFGDELGDLLGMPEGMAGGVVGGQVGGVPGGVFGGVVGGTGDIPIFDYDRAPRPIKITKPQYPQEAFVKKIEGTVLVEILIDRRGRVVRAQVLESIPLLDAAALETVKQWIFSPAIKDGRAVATVVNVPVGFRIF